MAILSFDYEDQFNYWKLEKTQFSDFNLLVGISGVGKTRILSTLNAVRLLGLSEGSLNGCKWELEFTSEGKHYLWRCENRKSNRFF